MQTDQLRAELERALQQRDAGAARGFVCVLDLRSARRGMESNPADHFFVFVALVALAVFLAGLWFAERPAAPLHFDAHAMQLTAWESPTEFLLADNFSPTQPN